MKDPSRSSAVTPDRQPLPVPTLLSKGFWEAARNHTLVVQRCDDCTAYRHYPQYLCPECRSSRWTWAPVSGRGRVYSFTVTHQPFGPYWATRVPFVVATIELAEGVRMMSDLPDEDTDDVVIDMPVEVFYDDLEGITLPRFRLVR
jgi:uncharacterized OB-fold protein